MYSSSLYFDLKVVPNIGTFGPMYILYEDMDLGLMQDKIMVPLKSLRLGAVTAPKLSEPSGQRLCSEIGGFGI